MNLNTTGYILCTVGTEPGDFCTVASVEIKTCAKLTRALQHMVKTFIVMLTVLQNCTDNIASIIVPFTDKKKTQNFEKRADSYDNITPPSLTLCPRAKAVNIGGLSCDVISSFRNVTRSSHALLATNSSIVRCHVTMN